MKPTPSEPNPATIDEWMASRPECVRALAKRHKLGDLYEVEGKTHWLIGYTENNMLILSPVDPGIDYDGSFAARIYVCAKHYEDPPGIERTRTVLDNGMVIESFSASGDAAMEIMGLKGSWIEDVLDDSKTSDGVAKND